MPLCLYCSGNCHQTMTRKRSRGEKVKVRRKKKTAIWFAGLPTWQLGLVDHLSSFLADKYPNPSKTSKLNQLRWDKERLDKAASPPAWKKSTCFCSRRGVHIKHFLSEVTNPLIFLFECSVAADQMFCQFTLQTLKVQLMLFGILAVCRT